MAAGRFRSLIAALPAMLMAKGRTEPRAKALFLFITGKRELSAGLNISPQKFSESHGEKGSALYAYAFDRSRAEKCRHVNF